MQTTLEPRHSKPAAFPMENLAALGAHSAGLAHEIRNAFVPVKTLVQVLLERHPNEDLGQLANRELARIDSLLSQMLRLAAPASAQRETVCIHQLLAYCLRLLDTQIAERKVTLKSSWNAAAHRVIGNSNQLQQVVTNLVLNAIEAMGPGGVLTLSTHNLESPEGEEMAIGGASHLAIEVQDTGSGISPEVQATLFQPFVTTKSGGTGLGLNLTRQIVEDHHGTISFQSRVGQGTTFTLLLPVEHVS